MLRLTREPGEAVEIQCDNGATVTITIGRKRGRRVTLEIEAPDRFKIMRTEWIPAVDEPEEAEG